MLKEARQLVAARVVTQDWSGGDEHAQHRQHQHASAPDAQLSQIDALMPLVRHEALASPVLLSPSPPDPSRWRAHSETQNRPHRAELELDGASATLLSRQNFDQRPMFDRIVGTGIAAHEGQLFAPLNQLLGLVTALSLWVVCISAIVMWWRRRPPRVLGAPPPANSRAAMARSLIAVILLLAIMLPLMGITLVLTLLAERLLLRRWAAAREFLGLAPG
jgi:uncharacterized iron-regulated membrane protein